MQFLHLTHFLESLFVSSARNNNKDFKLKENSVFFHRKLSRKNSKIKYVLLLHFFSPPERYEAITAAPLICSIAFLIIINLLSNKI